MGIFKELEIAMMDDPLYGISDRPVGMGNFENKLILQYFDTHATHRTCSYTGIYEKCLPLKDIVRYILEIITSYFTDPVNEAGWDQDFDDEGKVPGFTKLGGGYVVPDNKVYYKTTAELIHEEGLIVSNDDLRKDIIDSLPEQLWVANDLYGLNDAEIYSIDWRELERNSYDWICAKTQYPDLPVADRTRLFNLLELIHEFSDKLLLYTPLKVYRVVKYNKPLAEIEFSRLTSPPDIYAKDMRMNVAGKAVFYGASSEKCAKTESIGEESAVYYISEFESKHPLVLLDLRHLRERLTIFDIPSDKYYSLIFLNHFAFRISRPIADHNPGEYAPTQFVSNYFRNCLKKYFPGAKKLPIDGILYDSSKVHEDYCVALFYDNPTSANHLNLLNVKIIDKR